MENEKNFPEENSELNVVRELVQKLKREEQRLQALRTNAENIVPILDGLPHAKTAQSKVERLALKIIESENLVEELQAEILRAKTKLIDFILERVEEPNSQTLLVLRYVECLSFRETARRMHYCLRNIFLLHDDAKEFLHKAEHSETH